ncbi:MAG: hypothetical protein JXX28_04900 [Deltaproteobacteria bacterium]|nr:hypothetical protein [Deltaproteobacteria bacterium]
MTSASLPAAAGTLPVRIQVIDVEPFALNLVVPSYLPARDLTQRIARDAGLGGYWEDGSRRLYWLRARGRLLRDEERLEDLGVVPHELLHLLPQPPKGDEVVEQRPQYPPTHDYAGSGTLNLLAGLAMVLGWTLLWSVALLAVQSLWVGGLPSVGLALLTTSFARHAVGGEGSSVKVPILGLLIYLPLVVLAAVPPLFLSPALLSLPMAQRAIQMSVVLGPGLLAGLFGVMLAWLAWYGAVEKLPKQLVQEAQEVVLPTCALCGLPIEPEVLHPCPHGCGRTFHVGCYTARASVHVGDSCAVCGWTPGAQPSGA